MVLEVLLSLMTLGMVVPGRSSHLPAPLPAPLPPGEVKKQSKRDPADDAMNVDKGAGSSSSASTHPELTLRLTGKPGSKGDGKGGATGDELPKWPKVQCSTEGCAGAP